MNTPDSADAPESGLTVARAPDAAASDAAASDAAAGAAPHTAPADIRWRTGDAEHTARWHSEGGWPAPKRVVVVDDTLTADAAYRLAKSGTGLLWQGDFQNARQLLTAMARRVDRRRRTPADTLKAAFEVHRAEALRRARLLGLVLVSLDADHTLGLRRAPDVRQACDEAYGPGTEPSILSLRELLGVIGAHEWRVKGVPVAALGDRIHPHYGVFSPVRGEYLDLVATAPLPATGVAFDIGTGSGVIAAILARRGIDRVVATDMEPRALACARENLGRLGLADRVDVIEADLFPPGRADLVVCNPPWLPASAATSTDAAVYDPDSRMLRGFLAGLAGHLTGDGEGWLIISNLAELLGLRSRGELLDLIDDAGLSVAARLDTRPTHRKVSDATDPLHDARAAEVTSLWRLRPA
ncbi:class I SAM-dependent methyltransferase [Cryobacterium adonitolivorans]|uniref:Class I SAM-dependent methyltransferase n=1 Tax=Cryobacterium adonitolivorans TaxID=1259189 RepID=A0A4R8W094_9MICO|nr:class I SAM-dependent methyltransferase [Cryobacterium adonitolivorans]TFB98716.1 class I SAM-dependent methyltransferase [Cryobacterium adonitolivorans]